MVNSAGIGVEKNLLGIYLIKVELVVQSLKLILPNKLLVLSLLPLTFLFQSWTVTEKKKIVLPNTCCFVKDQFLSQSHLFYLLDVGIEVYLWTDHTQGHTRAHIM